MLKGQRPLSKRILMRTTNRADPLSPLRLWITTPSVKRSAPSILLTTHLHHSFRSNPMKSPFFLRCESILPKRQMGRQRQQQQLKHQPTVTRFYINQYILQLQHHPRHHHLLRVAREGKSKIIKPINFSHSCILPWMRLATNWVERGRRISRMYLWEGNGQVVTSQQAF